MIKKLYNLMYYARTHSSDTFYKVIKKLCISAVENLFPIVSIFYNYEQNRKINLTDKQIIISLTSYSIRLNKVHLTIKTLLRQTHRIDKIILWVSNEEYKKINDLPKKILKLQRYGLQIKLCEDLKSHKKYYYTLLENPDAITITVDDDTYYPEDLIETLIKGHLKYPKSICCLRGHYINLNKELNVDNYDKWNMEYEGEIKESIFICPTGCQGVLYPPGALNREVFNIDKFKMLCPKADDLWLKIMALKNTTSSVLLRERAIPFATIKGSQGISLEKQNNGNKENDIQLKHLLENYPEVIKVLRNHYDKSHLENLNKKDKILL